MMIMFLLTRYTTNSSVWLEHHVGKNTHAITGLFRKVYTEHFAVSDFVWEWRVTISTYYETRG